MPLLSHKVVSTGGNTDSVAKALGEAKNLVVNFFSELSFF